MSEAAAAFAAVEAIMEGRWDKYLHRIRGAVFLRTQTDAYQDTLIAGVSVVPVDATEQNDHA